MPVCYLDGMPVVTSTRWPDGLLARIQRYADAHGISRMAAMCALCSITLLDWERAERLPPIKGK